MRSMSLRHKVLFYIGAAIVALSLFGFGAVIVSGAPGQSSLSDVEQTLATERAKLPERPGREAIGALLNSVGARYEFIRLLRKDGGSRCPSPVGEVSCDIFIDIRTGRHYDVLGDSEGLAITGRFEDLGPCVLGPESGCELSRAVRPVLAEGPSTPVPAPVPDPGEAASIKEALARVEAKLDRIEAALSVPAPCPALPISREDFDALLAAVKAERPIEARGGWMVGTIRGTVGGVK